VSVINTGTDAVVATIAMPPDSKPFAVAAALDGQVFVTQLLAQLRPDGRTIDQKEGRDDGKEGRVTAISSATNTIMGSVVLNPLASTGFNSNGSVLDRIPATDPPTFTFATGAFPNLLQGIAIKGGRAFLRDPTLYGEIARIASAAQPAAGSLAAIIQRGNELFNTSTGPQGTVATSMDPAGRMSDTGWGNCYNCHPRGLTDGVTWMFPDGPRQTISMAGTGKHPQPAGSQLNANGAPLLPDFKQRVLNWSAVRDEIQDFELNIRAVSGGEGLITDGQGVFNLVPTANTGRSVDLDALAAYVVMGVRAPISPLRAQNVGGGQVDPEIAQGRALLALELRRRRSARTTVSSLRVVTPRALRGRAAARTVAPRRCRDLRDCRSAAAGRS
jgi:hypothetical protein